MAAEARAAGRTVLVLVPEIALTPAVAAVFRDVFGDRVAVQHSGLSDGERHDQWHRIRERRRSTSSSARVRRSSRRSTSSA